MDIKSGEDFRSQFCLVDTYLTGLSTNVFDAVVCVMRSEMSSPLDLGLIKNVDQTKVQIP